MPAGFAGANKLRAQRIPRETSRQDLIFNLGLPQGHEAPEVSRKAMWQVISVQPGKWNTMVMSC